MSGANEAGLADTEQEEDAGHRRKGVPGGSGRGLSSCGRSPAGGGFRVELERLMNGRSGVHQESQARKFACGLRSRGKSFKCQDCRGGAALGGSAVWFY